MQVLSQANRIAIQSIAQKHNVMSVRLFGSVAKGTSTPDSDLDLLVKFGEKTSLLDAIGFQQELEDSLHCKVDVVDEGGLSKYLRDKIMNEAVSL